MIEANVFVERASKADVINAAALVLTLMDLPEDSILDIYSKAGGVEMSVEFPSTLDYEQFLFDLEDVMGTSVTTYLY